MKDNKYIQSFNEHQEKLDISDVSNSKKYWFNDKLIWENERNKLNVSDDNDYLSKNENGKIIAFWYEDRNEGWIKK